MLACVSALGSARPAHAQDVPASAQGASISKVVFEGASAFPATVLQAAIETTARSCTRSASSLLCVLGLGAERQRLDLETLRADVLRLRLFYYQRGYRQAKIEAATTPAGRGLRVAFRIDEGEPIRVGTLDVIDPDSQVDAELFQDLPLRPGAPFGTTAYEATRDTLTARLSDHGYAHAQVLASYDLPRDSGGIARVRYEVIPGPLARFDSITVIGTRRIEPAVVRRLLTFQRGDAYSQDRILNSQRNLFGLELFRHVEIRPDFAASDSLLPVMVDVTEGDMHRVRYGVGLNTAEALNAEGTWTSRNFEGGARRLEVRGKISNIAAGPLAGIPFMETNTGKYAKLNGSLSVDFLQPWFFGPTNTLGIGLYAQRQSFPGVFVQTSEGAYLTFNRTLGRGTTLSLGYRPELTELDSDDSRLFCENLTICQDTAAVRVLSSQHWLVPLTVSLSRDHSNALFSPTSGSILRVDGEFAARGTGSDFSYWRLVAELSEYREVLPGIVFAAHVRPGFVKALAEATAGLGVHPQKRFFAGGPNSVRGFAQYQLGPKVLTVDAARYLYPDSAAGAAGCSIESIKDGNCKAERLSSGAFEVRPVGGGSMLEGNFELRFPLGWSRLRGAAFMDYGQLYTTPSDFRLRGLVWTPGAGVRYFSAIGPIRVDVGYRPQGQQLLSVLTTHVGARSADGHVTCDAAPDVAKGETAADCGDLHAIEPMKWPKGNSFFDHLQLHFSIGQAF